MSSKQLTAKVRLNTSDAEKSIDRLVQKINKIDNTLKKVNGNNKVEQQLTKSNNQVNGIKNKVLEWAKAQKQVTANTRATNGVLGSVGNKLKMLASTYLGIMGAKATIGASDTITHAENRLNNLEGGSPEATTEAMDKMYVAAQRSRSAYGDMLNNVSKTMTLAGNAFDNNIDNAIKFQEIMAKAYSVGGASDAEKSSSMYQLVQALGSGILQGDELRSVREGAPIAYKEIEKFAQGVLKTDESLKELASQGKITSDMVVAAIMNAGDTIESKFENTVMTFGQAWDMIKNMALQAFRPVLQMFNEVLNSDLGTAIINGIGHAFVFLANTILWVADIIGTVFNWFAENWSWIQYIVIFAIATMVAYFGYLAGVMIVTAIKSAIAWMVLHWQLLLTIIIIGGLVTAIVWLANNMASGAEFMIACLSAIALAVFAVGLIFNSTALMIIGIIIALVAGIISLLANCGEEVMSIVYQVGAFFYNFAAGVINQILQIIWAMIDPIIGVIEFILNACQGGFDGFGGACANLIGQIISWFLSLGKVVTTIIDAIFGTDWTSGLNNLQEKVLEWGKKEDAITINREAPTIQSIGDEFGLNIPNRISYADAGKAGAKKGRQIEKSLESFGSSLKNGISNFDLGKFTGTDMGDIFSGIGDKSGSYLPGITDPAYDLNVGSPEDFLKGLDSIDSNVGDIKDSMDLSNDDLEYLRKIADMEWRKEFTTAEIRVDMTNNNTVNSERDLDGIVDYLSDVLRSEMTNVAYGVHY